MENNNHINMVEYFAYWLQHYRKYDSLWSIVQSGDKHDMLLTLMVKYYVKLSDPSIKEDINRVRNNVNEDVIEITDKRYYLKRYKELVNRNKQLNKTNSEVSEDKNTNTNRYMGFHSKFMNPADMKRRFPKKELRAKERKIILYI